MSTADWKSSRLGDPQVSEILMGQSPPSSSYNEDGRGLPFFQGKADFGQLFPTIRKWCNLPSRVAERGDILISVRAPVGDVNFSGTSCCIGRGLAAIRPSQNIDARFLFFRLLTLKSILKSRASGTIFESINGPTLRDLEVSYPPLYEQKLISGVLWKIQQAIEVETNLIRVTRELKAAVMKKLFTEGLNREPQKESEIGMVPESWDLLSLGEYCEVENSSISYTDFSSLEHDGASDSSVQAMGVKVSDMNLAGNEKYFITANLLRTVNLELAQRKLVPERTVVFPKRGAAIATNKKRLTTAWTVLDPNLIGVRPIKGLDPEFLFFWFENFDLRTITEPGPTPQLNKKNLVPLKIAAPQQLEQQKDIATIISKLDSSVSQHSQKADRLTELFNEVLSLLMSGKISVADLELAPSLCHELVGVAA